MIRARWTRRWSADRCLPPVGSASALSVVVSLHRMPEGEPSGLGRMADRKPHMFGLVADRKPHMLGFVAHVARGGAQAMPDVARIVVDVGRRRRACRGKRPQNDTKEREVAQRAGYAVQPISPGARSVRNVHGGCKVNDESKQV